MNGLLLRRGRETQRGEETARSAGKQGPLKGRLWSKLWPGLASPRSPLGFVSPRYIQSAPDKGTGSPHSVEGNRFICMHAPFTQPQSQVWSALRESWSLCLILFGTLGDLFLPLPSLPSFPSPPFGGETNDRDCPAGHKSSSPPPLSLRPAAATVSLPRDVQTQLNVDSRRRRGVAIATAIVRKKLEG